MADDYDASDPEQVVKAEKAQKDRDRDVLYVLGGDRGRRWLYNLIWGECHIDRTSFVPGDEKSTSFNEGSRAIGNAIERELRAVAPKMYMKMLEENHFNV